MRTSVRMFALLLGVILPARAISAQPRTETSVSSDTLRLTRRQAIALALRANPNIAVAREQTLQARAQRVQAVAIADPILTVAFDSLAGLRNLRGAPQRPEGIAATVPFPDKLRLRGRIGTANIDAVESGLVLAQQQLASQAGRLYDGVLVVRLHQRDLLQARELSAEFLKRTEARFNAGTVPRLDVIKAQVDIAQADNDLIASRRDIANADAALNRALGRPLGALLTATDSLGVPDGLPALDAIEDAALRSRPELRAIEAQRRGARATSSLVRESAFLPDLTVGAGKDAALPAGVVFSVGISMPIPVMFWQHTRGDFAETKHRELELDATYRDARAAVSQDVRAAWSTADAALRQVVFLRDQLLPSAREAYRISSVSYGLGGLSALEVLDARRTLLSAQSQYADALAAANSSRSDLERAAGVALSTFAVGASRE